MSEWHPKSEIQRKAAGMTATGSSLEDPPRESTALSSQSFRTAIFWGGGVGIIQAASPIGFSWLDPDVVWATGLVVIAPVYVGLAVADGRRNVIVAEVGVASAFIILAVIAMPSSPWLVVFGLVAHGIKDLWQHRTHFVANTRWWPPFCLVVDFVAASAIAVVLLAGVDL